MLIMCKCPVTAQFFFKRADKNGHCEGDGGGHCHLQAAFSKGQRGGEICGKASTYHARYGALYAHRHGKDKIASDTEAI